MAEIWQSNNMWFVWQVSYVFQRLSVHLQDNSLFTPIKPRAIDAGNAVPTTCDLLACTINLTQSGWKSTVLTQKSRDFYTCGRLSFHLQDNSLFTPTKPRAVDAGQCGPNNIWFIGSYDRFDEKWMKFDGHAKITSLLNLRTIEFPSPGQLDGQPRQAWR